MAMECVLYGLVPDRRLTLTEHNLNTLKEYIASFESPVFLAEVKNINFRPPPAGPVLEVILKPMDGMRSINEFVLEKGWCARR